MKPQQQDSFTAVVLAADDNPADQNLTKRVLGRAEPSCDLRTVSDGEEALDYLYGRGRYADSASRPRPDLMLLDINMPRVDGIGVLEAIKGDANLRTIPVVMLTTSDYQEDILRSYNLGCNSFIKKPVDMPELVQVLEQLRAYWFELVRLPPEP